MLLLTDPTERAVMAGAVTLSQHEAGPAHRSAPLGSPPTGPHLEHLLTNPRCQLLAPGALLSSSLPGPSWACPGQGTAHPTLVLQLKVKFVLKNNLVLRAQCGFCPNPDGIAPLVHNFAGKGLRTKPSSLSFYRQLTPCFLQAAALHRELNYQRQPINQPLSTNKCILLPRRDL